MIRIRPDREEKKNQALGADHLAAAVEAMDRDGIVVMEDAVALDHIQLLSARMRDDMEQVRARRPIAAESSNESLPPPLNHPWLFRDICYNEFAIQIAHGVLGPGLYWDYYGSNTVHPHETRRQNTHHDARPLYAGELDRPLPAHNLVVKIPLTDFTEAKGATEVWLGSHRETRRLMPGTAHYEAMLAAHREGDRIMQMTAPRGAIVIRDMRIYHGGMPNNTGELRQMLAMVYNRPFYREFCWMPFAKGTEDFFQHPVLEAHCVFVDPAGLGVDYMYERGQRGLPDLQQMHGVVCGGVGGWQAI